MASIKCKACGRRYSYHDSDLCPHCGAYNKPSSRMRVDFDKDGNAELLNEKQFLQQSAVGRKRKDCYEQKECHEDQVRPKSETPRSSPLNSQQLMAIRQEHCLAERERKRKADRKLAMRLSLLLS